MSTDSTQLAPDDLVSVREAAALAGLSRMTVNTWIRKGYVSAEGLLGERRVSLAAVRARVTPPDPHAPTDARSLLSVASQAGVSEAAVRYWIQRSLLPSWRGQRGMVIRLADVQALAEQRGRATTAGKTEE